MKEKSETFNKFQEFKALVKNKTRKKICVLSSNNGGEFESHEFNEFYHDERIRRHLIVPYKTQQNGVSERKNKTICEVAKAMMCDQDLPTSLWEEAPNTTIYIKNIRSHAILGEKTHGEVFTGEKLDVGHLNIFNCPIYIHVAKEKRKNMDPS